MSPIEEAFVTLLHCHFSLRQLAGWLAIHAKWRNCNNQIGSKIFFESSQNLGCISANCSDDCVNVMPVMGVEDLHLTFLMNCVFFLSYNTTLDLENVYLFSTL